MKKSNLTWAFKPLRLPKWHDLILDGLPSNPRVSTTADAEVHDFTGGFSEAEGLRDTINQALSLPPNKMRRPQMKPTRSAILSIRVSADRWIEQQQDDQREH